MNNEYDNQNHQHYDDNYNANPYLSMQRFQKDDEYDDPEPPKGPVEILTGEEQKKGPSSLSSALMGGAQVPNNNPQPQQNMNYNSMNPNPNYNQQQMQGYYQNPNYYPNQPMQNQQYPNNINNQQYNPYFNNNNNNQN